MGGGEMEEEEKLSGLGAMERGGTRDVKAVVVLVSWEMMNDSSHQRASHKQPTPSSRKPNPTAVSCGDILAQKSYVLAEWRS